MRTALFRLFPAVPCKFGNCHNWIRGDNHNNKLLRKIGLLSTSARRPLYSWTHTVNVAKMKHKIKHKRLLFGYQGLLTHVIYQANELLYLCSGLVMCLKLGKSWPLCHLPHKLFLFALETVHGHFILRKWHSCKMNITWKETIPILHTCLASIYN